MNYYELEDEVNHRLMGLPPLVAVVTSDLLVRSDDWAYASTGSDGQGTLLVSADAEILRGLGIEP